MDDQIIVSTLLLLLSGLGVLLLHIFNKMGKNLEVLSIDIKELNQSIATILNDQKWHKELISDLKSRVEKIESKEDL